MPLSVSDTILCEIGRIAIYQSHIEGQLSLFIQELLYLDDSKGNLITHKLSFRALVDLLGALIKNEFGDQHKHSKKFKEICKEISKLEEQRNKFVHSMWGFGSTLGPDTATRVKVIKTKRESVQVTLQELQEVSKNMEQLEWAIGDLRVTICHHEAAARHNSA